MRVMAHAEAVTHVHDHAQQQGHERHSNDPFRLSDAAWRTCGEDAHELPDELWHITATPWALEEHQPGTATGPQPATTQPQPAPAASDSTTTHCPSPSALEAEPLRVPTTQPARSTACA